MEYKNIDNFGKKIPVVTEIGVSYISFKPQEVKDIDLDENKALMHGLEKVEVKAVKSSIGKMKVETKIKKVKSRKKK